MNYWFGTSSLGSTTKDDQRTFRTDDHQWYLYWFSKNRNFGIYLTRADEENLKFLRLPKGEKIFIYRYNYIIQVSKGNIIMYDYTFECVIDIYNLDRGCLRYGWIIAWLSDDKILHYDGEKITFSGQSRTIIQNSIDDNFVLIFFIQAIASGLTTDQGSWSNFLLRDLYDPRLLCLIRQFYGPSYPTSFTYDLQIGPEKIFYHPDEVKWEK